jgi:hypothetical protein
MVAGEAPLLASLSCLRVLEVHWLHEPLPPLPHLRALAVWDNKTGTDLFTACALGAQTSLRELAVCNADSLDERLLTLPRLRRVSLLREPGMSPAQRGRFEAFARQAEARCLPLIDLPARTPGASQLKAALDKELRWTELRLYEGDWRSGDW